MHILFDTWFVLECRTCPYCTHSSNARCRRKCMCAVYLFESHSNSLYSFSSEIMFVCIVRRMVESSTNAIPFYFFSLPFQNMTFFSIPFFATWLENILLQLNRERVYTSLIRSVDLILHHWIETLSRLFAVTENTYNWKAHFYYCRVAAAVAVVAAAHSSLECLHCK